MNLILKSYLSTMFYDSQNTSKDMHNGFLFTILATLSRRLEKVVAQVVIGNASNNIAASRLLTSRCPSIFWTFCVAHTISLMQDIAAIKPIRCGIVMAREVIVFLYGHTHMLDWKRECTKGDLIRPGVSLNLLCMLPN